LTDRSAANELKSAAHEHGQGPLIDLRTLRHITGGDPHEDNTVRILREADENYPA
jgi:hypothetical protein